MKRIIILRHGEEPVSKKIRKISSKIGLSCQGAVRALLMPEIISKLTQDKYELHTYKHNVNGVPTSRSYYTTFSLHNTAANLVFYGKSDEIKELIHNINASKFDTIIICWEHLQIPAIIKKLTGKKPKFNKAAKKIYKIIQNVEKVPRQIVEYSSLKSVEVCAPDYIEQNIDHFNEAISLKKDIKYSMVWDIDMLSKTFNVYASYLIEKRKHFVVQSFI